MNNSLDSKPNIPYDNDTATLDVLEEMGRLGTVDKVEDLRDCIGEPITNKEEDIKQGRKLHKSNHSMRMNEMRGKMFIFSRFSFYTSRQKGRGEREEDVYTQNEHCVDSRILEFEIWVPEPEDSVESEKSQGEESGSDSDEDEHEINVATFFEEK